MSFCSMTKGVTLKMCRLCVCVTINKRCFECFVSLDVLWVWMFCEFGCLWVWMWLEKAGPLYSVVSGSWGRSVGACSSLNVNALVLWFILVGRRIPFDGSKVLLLFVERKKYTKCKISPMLHVLLLLFSAHAERCWSKNTLISCPRN